MRLLFALVLAALLWTRTAAARGDERIAIAVIVEGDRAVALPEAGLRARVEQELVMRGHEVAPLELGGTDHEHALLVAARRADAALAVLVWLPADATRIEIRVADRVTGKSLRRVLDRESDASTIALATAELVDASLVEVELPHVTMPRERIAPTIPHPRVVAVPPQRWSVGAAFGVLWPVLQREPLAVASVSLAIRVAPRVAIAPEGTLPLHAMTDAPPNGAVRTLPFLLAVRTDIDVLPFAARTRLDVQAALTATALRIDATADGPGFRARSVTVWSAAALLGLVVRRDFGEHFRLGGGVRTYVPFERIRVRAFDTTVRDFGAVWPLPFIELAARW